MGDPKTTNVEFHTLAIGQRFFCYVHSENGSPRWCECVKHANNFATETGGIQFRLSGESLVFLDKAAFEAQKPASPTFTGKIVYPAGFKIYEVDGVIKIEGGTLPIDRVWDAIESLQTIAFNHYGAERYNVGRELPNPETLPDVTYIPVAPDDHDELVRKADLYNELKAVIERLDCEIQDLKARFV